jgi:hypothetical protein
MSLSLVKQGMMNPNTLIVQADHFSIAEGRPQLQKMRLPLFTPSPLPVNNFEPNNAAGFSQQFNTPHEYHILTLGVTIGILKDSMFFSGLDWRLWPLRQC